MDAIECIKTRMSIRQFKKEPVERSQLEELIDIARWSPSYKNTQPWEIVILSGAKKEALSARLVELFQGGASPSPDIPEPQSWPPAEEARIAHLYKSRADAFGIDLNDPGILKKAKIANFNFYGAPHALYLFQDSSLTPWSLFDMGLFAQSFMLAAHARGIGTVPQAFATDYARDVKSFLDIPETKRLILGISIGFPLSDKNANSFRTDRADTKELVRWIE